MGIPPLTPLSTGVTAQALVRLARPKGGAALLFYPLVGYGFALWDASCDVTGLGRLGFVLLAWFVASAGTMWLNARLDGDERGGALFAAPAPENRPAHLGAWGVSAIAFGVGLCWFAGPRPFAACVGCALLSILYSHPSTRWKSHPVLGPAVNGLGYGLLSPFAGFATVGVPLSPRAAIVFVCISIWTVGATFAAQAFQRDDDARRAYRTLVVTHGPATCLRVTRVATFVPLFALTTMSIVGILPRALLFGVPFFALVDRHLVQWMREPEGGNPAWATGYMVRMLAGGVLFVGLATADFLYDFLGDRPAGGVATAHWRSPQ